MIPRQLVERLSEARDDASRPVQVEGAECVRVGRNDVWRVTAGDSVLFVTYCKTEGEFRRRLAGIQLTERMAQGNPTILAPRLEAADEVTRVIIVHRVRGIPVSGLFQRAYRLDRNPLHRRPPRARFVRALASVTGFLQAVHEQTPVAAEYLWDHGPQGVLQRVREHLDRVSPQIQTLRGLRVPELREPAHIERRFLLGDTTLGNFIVDEERVACVDFEDLGIGEPRRDLLLLNDSLRRAFRGGYYWRRDSAELASPTDSRDPWLVLYALEVSLLRLKAELRPAAPPSAFRGEAAAARRQLVVLNELAR